MTIVNVSLSTLAAGKVVELTVGQTLRISVSFKYTVAQAITAVLQACPYQYKLGIRDRIEGSKGSAEVSLEATLTPKTKQATVDMPVVPKAQGGIDNGTYGLMVEVLGTDVEAHIDDCLVISGNPVGITDILPALMAVMMMGMVVPMMETE